MGGEGYVILFAFLAFGLPMLVWSFGEDWVKKCGTKGWLVLGGAGLAFVIGVIIFSYISAFIES